jgi:hypothetical protein
VRFPLPRLCVLAAVLAFASIGTKAEAKPLRLLTVGNSFADDATPAI